MDKVKNWLTGIFGTLISSLLVWIAISVKDVPTLKENISTLKEEQRETNVDLNTRIYVLRKEMDRHLIEDSIIKTNKR